MSLPDFLGTKPDYQLLIKLHTVFYPQQSGPVQARLPKDAALAEFYTQRHAASPSLSGYENVAAALLDI
jgi:hypothetical protein